MGALTEVEIFSCMAENLRLAAQHADDLAVKPFKGPIYELYLYYSLDISYKLLNVFAI